MKIFITPSNAAAPVRVQADGAGTGRLPGLPDAQGWYPGWGPSLPPWLDALRDLQPDPEGGHYRQALDTLASRPAEPIGLSLRLPFCAVHCLCCDRDIHAAPSESQLDDYVASLVREIHTLADRLGARREVLQLQLGGGSVNLLDESQLAQLVHALRQRWSLPADAELAADCDARRAGWGQLRLLRGLGFRQLSFGVLDLDPAVQRACGRLQSAALIDDVCGIARACGIEGITLGLMIGLPMQTEERWRSTLQAIVAIAPDRVTLTRYRHRPEQVPGQNAIDADALPDDSLCRTLTAMTGQVLCAVGYRWIGADHFVLDGDPLSQALDHDRLRRNLIGYTATPPMPLLGLGVGAIGELDGGIFCNERALPRWREAVGAGRLAVSECRPGNAQQLRRRAAIEHLLCRLELPSAALQGGLEDWYQQLAVQAADGLVQVLADRIVVTEAGRHDLLGLCAGLHALPAAAPPTRPSAAR